MTLASLDDVSIPRCTQSLEIELSDSHPWHSGIWYCSWKEWGALLLFSSEVLPKVTWKSSWGSYQVSYYTCDKKSWTDTEVSEVNDGSFHRLLSWNSPQWYFLCDLGTVVVKYLFFHQLRLSMEHHERVSTNAPPHCEAYFVFELAFATRARCGRNQNLDSHSCELSALPYLAILPQWRISSDGNICFWALAEFGMGGIPSIGIYNATIVYLPSKYIWKWAT